MLLKIEKNADNAGQAQDQLRGIISLMNLGHKKGDGWVFGEGEIEHAPEIRAQLKNPVVSDLCSQVQLLIEGKDIREADAETVEGLAKLVPMLVEALCGEGYGLPKAPDSASTQAEEGDKAKDEESGDQEVKDAPRGSQEATEGGEKVEKKRFPWDQRS